MGVGAGQQAGQVPSCRRSMPRATKRALTPSAKLSASTGESIEPWGVDGERVPSREVGEYWPLVRP